MPTDICGRPSVHFRASQALAVKKVIAYAVIMRCDIRIIFYRLMMSRYVDIRPLELAQVTAATGDVDVYFVPILVI